MALAVTACAPDDNLFGSETSVQIMHREMLNATVRVEIEKGTGSGTVIRSDETGTFIITNHHVAGDEGGTVHVRFWLLNSRSETVLSVMRDAKVVAADDKRDLALLRLVDSEFRAEAVASLAPEGVELAPGEDVWVAGSPIGLRAYITHGLLSLAAEKQVMTSAPVIYGNSGGGVYHRTASGDYEYIGTVQAIYGLPDMMGMVSHPITAINVAISNQVLRAFLKDAGFDLLA